MILVMGDKRNCISCSCGRDPAVSRIYVETNPHRFTPDVCPSSAEFAIRINNRVGLEESSQLLPSVLSPFARVRPKIQLRNCHERENTELPINMRPIKLSASILLEQVCQDYGVHQ